MFYLCTHTKIQYSNIQEDAFDFIMQQTKNHTGVKIFIETSFIENDKLQCVIFYLFKNGHLNINCCKVQNIPPYILNILTKTVIHKLINKYFHPFIRNLPLDTTLRNNLFLSTPPPRINISISPVAPQRIRPLFQNDTSMYVCV